MEAIIEQLSAYLGAYAWIPGLMWGAFETWRGWKKNKKIMAGYESTNRILKAVKKGKGIGLDDIKGIVRNAQEAYGVWPMVKKDLDKLWAKAKIRKVESEEA